MDPVGILPGQIAGTPSGKQKKPEMGPVGVLPGQIAGTPSGNQGVNMVSSHGPGSGAPPFMPTPKRPANPKVPKKGPVTPPGPKNLPPGKGPKTPPGPGNLPKKPQPKPGPVTPPGPPNLPPGGPVTPPGPPNLPPPVNPGPIGPKPWPGPTHPGPEQPPVTFPGFPGPGADPNDPSGGRGTLPPVIDGGGESMPLPLPPGVDQLPFDGGGMWMDRLGAGGIVAPEMPFDPAMTALNKLRY